MPTAASPREVVDQIDKEFVPYVKPVRTGSFVQFPNKDHIRHHVYSFSAPSKFELPLYMGTPAQPVLFDKPGVVKLGCNIHDWMIGYVYVTDSPLLREDRRRRSRRARPTAPGALSRARLASPHGRVRGRDGQGGGFEGK